MSIQGKILTPIGAPLSNGVILITSTSSTGLVPLGIKSVVVLERDGSYEFDLLVGSYNIAVRSYKGEENHVQGEVEITAPVEDTLTLYELMQRFAKVEEESSPEDVQSV